MKIRLAVIGALALLVLGGIALLYREATAHGFSAREKPWAIEEFLARRLRRLATGLEAKSRKNPLDSSPAAIEEARDHFADHCAVCHANDGSGKTAINEGLYPPAPNLREAETQRLTDGELFAIIRNGIRFTGMPGWDDSDEEIWELVLFLRHLPDLSAEELELMREIRAAEPPMGARRGAQHSTHVDHP